MEVFLNGQRVQNIYEYILTYLQNEAFQYSFQGMPNLSVDILN